MSIKGALSTEKFDRKTEIAEASHEIKERSSRKSKGPSQKLVTFGDIAEGRQFNLPGPSHQGKTYVKCSAYGRELLKGERGITRTYGDWVSMCNGDCILLP